MAITVYTYNDKVLKNVATDKWLKKAAAPLPSIPANTVRVRTSDGNAPIKGTYTSYDSATLVTGTSDVYDVYKSGNEYYNLLYQSTNVVEVLGVNSTGITNMNGMFKNCFALTTVHLFDTSGVQNMNEMFSGCSSLTSIPLFDTSNVYNMDSMFYWCSKVESGALALYQQASTQTTPPSSHSGTFDHCGSSTTTGAAELAQIPSDWK